jgi:hypothetical protein
MNPDEQNKTVAIMMYTIRMYNNNSFRTSIWKRVSVKKIFISCTLSASSHFGSMIQTGLLASTHADLVTDSAFDYYGLRLATTSLDQRSVQVLQHASRVFLT